MAAAVGIDIEDEIDGARTVAELTKLVKGVMGAQGTGGVAKTCLPQRAEIDHAFDEKCYTQHFAEDF